MSDAVTQFLQSIADCFQDNDLAIIARAHTLPSAVYFTDQILVSHTFEEIENTLSTYRNALLKAGWTRSKYKVLAQSLPRNSQVSIWADWIHLNASSNIISQSKMRLFCTTLGSQISKVQLVEYLDTPSKPLIKDLPLISA